MRDNSLTVVRLANITPTRLTIFEGVQSALKHDQLMETGTPDYALVEGEAEKIAKEAVKALRESRRHYARPFNNIQTSNPSSKPIFGKKTFGQKASPGNESSSNGKVSQLSNKKFSDL